jgi:translation initiation factor eIF-2B subunit gamma
MPGCRPDELSGTQPRAGTKGRRSHRSAPQRSSRGALPQAVAGDVATSRLSAWLNQNSKVQCEVVTVPEEACTAAALRSLEGKIRAETFVVVSGDLISEMPLKPIVAAHQLSRSLCTVLLSQRRSSPSAETKPGKAPKAVDYIGLDAGKQRLLFHASSPDTVRDLKVGMGVVRRYGRGVRPGLALTCSPPS